MIDHIVNWIVTQAIWLFQALVSTSLGLLDSILPKVVTAVIICGIVYYVMEIID